MSENRNDRQPRKTERFNLIPIFSTLTADETSRINKITSEVQVPAGEDVFAPGSPADGFYIIKEGRVQVSYKPDEAEDPITLATLSNLSVFGEMSFLADRQRSGRVTALLDTRLGKVDGQAFRDLLGRGDLAAYKVVHNFALLAGSRLRRVENELMAVLSELEAESREIKLAELQQFRHKLFEEWSF